MSAMERLMPAADRAVRCSEFSREIGLDPGGTALAVDEILVADVGLPWPKPAFAADGFEAVPTWVERATATGRRVRVLASVPSADAVPERVVVHSRPFAGAAFLDRVEHRVEVGAVAGLLESLLTGGLSASPDTEVGRGARTEELLICTQGSHDLCCGSIGTRFVAEMGRLRPGVAMSRVSHTGGHRFAPTGVSLPGGRMWGGTTVAEMIAILDRSISPSTVLGRCRGWTGADSGPAQVAERAVFAQIDDWSFEDSPRQVEVVVDDDDATTVLVGWEDRWWEVVVEVGREVPTIACSQPGGLPAKPGREYRVRDIRVVE